MEVIRQAGIVGAIGVIARLLVDPDVRRQGIARALLQTARAAAVSQNGVPVLDVVETDHAAVALHRRSGWVELGRVAVSLPEGRELHELVFAASA
jgi:GNAT superfamily N-acetyltransferase